VTAVLALSAGERPPLTAMGGAGLLLLGVVIATRPSADPQASRPSLVGVPEAILSALAFGTMFWLFSFFVEPRMGYGWPLVLLKTMAVCSSMLVLVSQRRQEKKSLRITLGFGAVM